MHRCGCRRAATLTSGCGSPTEHPDQPESRLHRRFRRSIEERERSPRESPPRQRGRRSTSHEILERDEAMVQHRVDGGYGIRQRRRTQHSKAVRNGLVARTPWMVMVSPSSRLVRRVVTPGRRTRDVSSARITRILRVAVVPADSHHVRSRPAADRRRRQAALSPSRNPLTLVRLEQLLRDSYSSGRVPPTWAINCRRESPAARACAMVTGPPEPAVVIAGACRIKRLRGGIRPQPAAGSSRTPRATFRVPAEPV